MCGECEPSHCDHQTRDWAALRSSLDTVLRRAVNQIVQKMETLDWEVEKYLFVGWELHEISGCADPGGAGV